MLKWLAVLSNLVLIGFLAFMGTQKGFPDILTVKFLAVLAFAALPVINLAYIFTRATSAKAPSSDEENIIALWLRVKKAELRKRLD